MQHIFKMATQQKVNRRQPAVLAPHQYYTVNM